MTNDEPSTSPDDVLSAPDPSRPGAFFRDGEDIFLVEVLPLRMPTFLIEVRNASFAGAILVVLTQGLLGWWLWARDPRSKLVILRRRGRPLAWFHAVATEAVQDEHIAEDRRREVLANWVPGAFA